MLKHNVICLDGRTVNDARAKYPAANFAVDHALQPGEIFGDGLGAQVADPAACRDTEVNDDGSFQQVIAGVDRAGAGIRRQQINADGHGIAEPLVPRGQAFPYNLRAWFCESVKI